jgi:signal transduction histidine kinase
VRVRLVRVADGLHLAVEDDGIGFEPPGANRERPMSLGLASMRERAELLGGELEIDARPGEGTAVVAWLPLPDEPSAGAAGAR